EVALVPVEHLVEAGGDRMLVVGEQDAASPERRSDAGSPAAEVSDRGEGSPRRVDDVEAASAQLHRQGLNVRGDERGVGETLAGGAHGLLRAVHAGDE